LSSAFAFVLFELGLLIQYNNYHLNGIFIKKGGSRAIQEALDKTILYHAPIPLMLAGVIVLEY